MQKVDWKVEGMTCSNCALTVSRFLEKQGMQEVKVSPLDGNVSFIQKDNADITELKSGIKSLGYRVVDIAAPIKEKAGFLTNYKQRFLFTLPFTLVLMLHMLDRWWHIHWLMNPWVQMLLCLPVFITGMWFFGRSALKSLRNKMPNMNVLVSLGALAAFVYSLTGAIFHLGNEYLFFETSASIITLVFLGNYLEEVSVQSTQKAIQSLAKAQKVMANMIAYDAHQHENIFPVENNQLHTGDLVLIKTGEQVPADCKILWGDCTVNESIVTGESIPLAKSKKDFLIGGSIVETGTVKAQVTAVGEATILSGIVRMVQHAQSEKPPMQKLADKISAVFVPLVIGIGVLSFLLNYFAFNIPFGPSLMRSIAVLVISCPCAMGLATPAAIAVGLGRAAKKGILFRNASSLESFKTIRQVVFDKTGTLTTGRFEVAKFRCEIEEKLFKEIVYSLEKFSNHPIARSVSGAWKTNQVIKWKSIEEIKGSGIRGVDYEGNIYIAGSNKLLDVDDNENHNIYVVKNNKMLGWIDVKDEIRPESKQVIQWLHRVNIKTILLSGDRKEKAEAVAKELGIKETIAEKTPQQKLEKITELNNQVPTAMVGDGINDAPALAKATLGISLSDASHLAMQSADVILMNNGLKYLPEALGLGRHTFITIKQNLFWAFAYNIIAIPIAAIGLLTPAFSALAMGFSDVVLGINSVRLFVKKVV